MKYYLTKYCLANGIEEVEGEPLDTDSNIIKLSKGIWAVFSLGKDIFESKDDAIVKANLMLQKKIQSTRKQLLKLENTKF